MDFELTASMMVRDYGNLKKEFRELEAGGIDYFHIDIMDGKNMFANFAMSVEWTEIHSKPTRKPLRSTLMIEPSHNLHRDVFWTIFKDRRYGIHSIPRRSIHPSTIYRRYQWPDDTGIAVNRGTSLKGIRNAVRNSEKVLGYVL